MDVNSEIAARATAVLTLLQDWLAGPPPSPSGRATAYPITVRDFGQTPCAEVLHYPAGPELCRRAQELVPETAAGLTPPEAWTLLLQQAHELVGYLLRLRRQLPGEMASVLDPEPLLTEDSSLAALLDAPQPSLPAAWRQHLRRALNGYPRLRRHFAAALGFEPLLLRALLAEPALAEHYAPVKEHIEMTRDFTPFEVRRPWRLLPAAALIQPAEAIAPVPAPDADPVRAARLAALLDDPELVAALLDATLAAVPFSHVQGRELEDITARRAALYPTPVGKAEAGPELHPFAPGPGPTVMAGRAELLGLALSGGGIRSATFCLGVVQALAQRGWLPRLDYLSTVSGGGYLGSWLVAWVQRAGSVRKVAQRLSPLTAPNPRGEETRPIRWLRSFSNYLAPSVSALSVDVWTVGLTWFRNAVLNQVILLLMLSAGLGVAFWLRQAWPWLGYHILQPLPLWLASNFSAFQSFTPEATGRYTEYLGLALATALLLYSALITGRRQGEYQLHRRGLAPGGKPYRWLTSTSWLAWLLAALFGAGVLLSSYAFFHEPELRSSPAPWLQVGVPLLLALLLVAALGRYDLCYEHPEPRRWHRFRSVVLVLLFSALAALAGTIVLLAGWRFLWQQQERSVALVLGPAGLVETLGLLALVRLGLLGRNFPDERREWWGRLGAQAQLAAIGWVVGLSLVLLGPLAIDALACQLENWWPAVATGLAASWLTIVGKGVALAGSAATPAQPTANSPAAPADWRSRLVQAVPYVFIIGLLLSLSYGVRHLLRHLPEWLPEQRFRWLQHSFTHPAWAALFAIVVLGGLAWLLARRLGVNEFSMHHFYKNRLLRAYLGASRRRAERQANPFTDFDGEDDLKLCRLRPDDPLRDPADPPYLGPLPLLNTALNVTRGGEQAHQDRMAESFTFTPRYCGFDFARTMPVQPADATSAEYAYRPTAHYAYPADNGPGIGTVMAISGAAANPNMGYHSSPVTAFLLTLFNVRLGWWMGNPRQATWQDADPRNGLLYLLRDLAGRAKATDPYVCLSDGGHFDNMGLYELVRRRCRYVVLCDAEEDAHLRFEGIANAIRRVRVDFGVEIELNLTPLVPPAGERYAAASAVRGIIRYPDQPADQPGYLLYIKATLTGKEPVDVREYAHQNTTFPHQSTGDQFFSEPQFESYRRLGYCTGLAALPEVPTGPGLPSPAALFPAEPDPGLAAAVAQQASTRVVQQPVAVNGTLV
ncbi:patatin-like phospholipase family protein [Hymenobacter terricola]|uniref:patatin-like phospholipase family protein n=1 Tax=Hymenobacter terricola TaxID=2819236 RepID=UPI001B3019C8|nr:patatin-like phospholipase family protein [Hymenobacter terricola]